MHDWALAERAVALKVLWDIQDDLRAGRLIGVLEPYECDEVKLYLTSPTRSYRPPRLRLFIDFVVGAIQTVALDVTGRVIETASKRSAVLP